jgi:hypothetical protein
MLVIVCFLLCRIELIGLGVEPDDSVDSPPRSLESLYRRIDFEMGPVRPAKGVQDDGIVRKAHALSNVDSFGCADAKASHVSPLPRHR